jgi:hypothetical protein
MTLVDKKGNETLLKAGERAPFNSGAPICLVGYGEENDKHLAFSGLGKWIKL